MAMSEQFTPEQERAIEKVRKLLSLAGNNPNPEESASATAKAQELLAAYNLDLSTMDRAGGASVEGRREDAATLGGTHAWQRKLWRGVAELNWCLYFQTTAYMIDPSGKTKKYGRRAQHRLVGRRVNVAATVAMATYLQQAIERVRQEAYQGQHLHDSRAHAFREGAADNLVERLVARRNKVLAEERAKQAEAARGSVTSQALTIAGLSQSEQDENMDFLYGAGYSARRRADVAERQARWAEERAAQATSDAAAEAAYTKWAAANPEEARKAAEKREQEAEKDARRWANRGAGSRGGTSHLKHVDSNAYYAGRDAAKDISLDPQVNSGSNSRRIK